MTWIPEIERPQYVASLLEKIEATLAALSGSYRFDRFGGTFCERPYFLLSHSAHLMFSLWRIEQDSDGDLFRKTGRPCAFSTVRGFDSLRYLDLSRDTLHGGSLDEQVKNETKWFRFWVDTLKTLDPVGAPAYTSCCEQLLHLMDEAEFLTPEASQQSQHLIEALTPSDAFGRLLRYSMTVLEDLSSAAGSYLSSLDPKDHAIEQMTAVACGLKQIRRTLIWETPARGPYIPDRSVIWPMPSRSGARSGRHARGMLKVVPRRDGGAIVCTFEWVHGSEGTRSRWTLGVSDMACPYEKKLFDTWAYDSGVHVGDPDPSPDARAFWIVQSEQALNLERRSQQMESLLERLTNRPTCDAAVKAVSGLLRDHGPRWSPGSLPWTYIRQLDQVLARLHFTCREAKVLGGEDAADRAIRKIWSSQSAAELTVGAM